PRTTTHHPHTHTHRQAIGPRPAARLPAAVQSRQQTMRKYNAGNHSQMLQTCPPLPPSLSHHHTHTYTHTHTHTLTSTRANTNTHWNRRVCTHTHTCRHTDTYTHKPPSS